MEQESNKSFGDSSTEESPIEMLKAHQEKLFEEWKRTKAPMILEAVAARFEEYVTDPSVRVVGYDVSAAEKVRNGELIESKSGLKGAAEEVCYNFNLNLKETQFILNKIFGRHY